MSQPPPEGSAQGLAITVKSPPLPYSWARAMPVIIMIDDWPFAAAQHGRNIVTVPPGRHRVHVHIRYGYPRRMGPADHEVVVAPGQWTELEYKAPLWTLGSGSLGPPPQRYNGLIPIVALLVIALATAVLMLVLTL